MRRRERISINIISTGEEKLVLVDNNIVFNRSISVQQVCVGRINGASGTEQEIESTGSREEHFVVPVQADVVCLDVVEVTNVEIVAGVPVECKEARGVSALLSEAHDLGHGDEVTLRVRGGVSVAGTISVVERVCADVGVEEEGVVALLAGVRATNGVRQGIARDRFTGAGEVGDLVHGVAIEVDGVLEARGRESGGIDGAEEEGLRDRVRLGENLFAGFVENDDSVVVGDGVGNEGNAAAHGVVDAVGATLVGALANVLPVQLSCRGVDRDDGLLIVQDQSITVEIHDGLAGRETKLNSRNGINDIGANRMNSKNNASLVDKQAVVVATAGAVLPLGGRASGEGGLGPQLGAIGGVEHVECAVGGGDGEKVVSLEREGSGLRVDPNGEFDAKLCGRLERCLPKFCDSLVA